MAARSTSRRSRGAAPTATVEAPATAMPDILRALIDEHKYQARLLKLLEKQVGVLNLKQDPDWAAMVGVMRYMTQYPDRFHHPKEDLLFDKVVQREPSARRAVDELLAAHRTIIEKGRTLLEAIERCRDGGPGADRDVLRKAAHAYIGALRRHMDVEGLQLFPLAQRVLRPEDWREVDRRMKPILDPVFGGTPAPEFRDLHAAEAVRPEPAPPGKLGTGLIEAAALIETVATLIAGASRMRQDLTRHNKDALRANQEMWREILRLVPRDPRLNLVGELYERNLTMFTEFNNRMIDQWSGIWKAAWRPYEEGDGPYAPKLLRKRRDKPKAGESADGTSAGSAG